MPQYEKREIWRYFGFIATFKLTWNGNSLLFSKCISVVLLWTIHACMLHFFHFFDLVIFIKNVITQSNIEMTDFSNNLVHFKTPPLNQQWTEPSPHPFSFFYNPCHSDIHHNIKKLSAATSISSWLKIKLLIDLVSALRWLKKLGDISMLNLMYQVIQLIFKFYNENQYCKVHFSTE